MNWLNTLITNLWWVKRLPVEDERNFSAVFRQRSFRVALVATLISALTGTALFYLRRRAGLPLPGSQTTFGVPLFFVAIWTAPLVFLTFRRWSEQNYPWVICFTFAISTFTLLWQASTVRPQLDAVQALQIRAMFSYFFVTCLWRLPFRFALVLSLASFLPFSYLLWAHGGILATSSILACGVIVALGLFMSWILEERERQIFIDGIESKLAETASLNALGEVTKLAEKEKKQLREFIEQAVHDIRQPLAGIVTTASVVKQSEARGNKQSSAEAIKVLLWALHDLSTLSTNILDLTRYETGEWKLEKKALYVRDIILQIERLYRKSAEDKKLAFKIFLPTHEPLITLSHSNALCRVLSNLMHNAIKFTAPNKENTSGVGIGAVGINDRFIFYVWDTGVGIENTEEIWKYGNSSHGTQGESGYGVGLALVRAICVALGHRIELRSSVGRQIEIESDVFIVEHGSRFTIETPRINGSIHDVSNLNNNEDSSEELFTEIDARVILIEDNPAVRKALELFLQQRGFEVWTGKSCAEVISAKNRNDCPDAILTDFQLGGQETGAEAIRAIRAHFGKCIPAILVTGLMSEEPKLSIQDLEQTILLEKPFKPQRLHKALYDVLASQTV